MVHEGERRELNERNRGGVKSYRRTVNSIET